jgi:hypothetical protein
VIALLLLRAGVAVAGPRAGVVGDRPRSIPRSHFVDLDAVPPAERLTGR